jgi:uncharacterized protein YjbJ (UPF0337 family)
MDLSNLADKAGDAAQDLAGKMPDGVKDQASGLAEKAGAMLGTAAEKLTDKLPDSVKDKAAGLADKAVEAATDALGAAADKLSRK